MPWISAHHLQDVLGSNHGVLSVKRVFSARMCGPPRVVNNPANTGSTATDRTELTGSVPQAALIELGRPALGIHNPRIASQRSEFAELKGDLSG